MHASSSTVHPTEGTSSRSLVSASHRRSNKGRRKRSLDLQLTGYPRPLEPLSPALPPPLMESDWPRRIASSPQLVRTGRTRSSSASSSASLTATEDNFRRREDRAPTESASSSRLTPTTPAPWTALPAIRHAARSSEAQSSSGTEDSEDVRDTDLIYLTRSSSSSVSNAALRSRRLSGRRKDVDVPRMVTTARGQPCAGETETELDEMVSTEVFHS